MPVRVRRAAVVLLPVCVVMMTTLPGPRTAAGQERFLESVTHNVVRVRSEGAGFGFIVGVRPGELLIATARHTLGDSWEPRVQVCFAPRGERCESGRVVYWADPIGNQPALDLVILAVPDHGDVAWRPDVEGSADPGDPVWVIGRSADWWISPRPGTVTKMDPAARHVSYQDLDVAPGVSGAPIIGRTGIVAMHLQEARSEQEARGLDLSAIRERVSERVEGRWALVPPATCDRAPAQARDLAGTIVAVRIDPRRPERALEAMATLHCVGARTLPRQVADPSAWAGDAVVYGTGDLRSARAVQVLLSSLGRTETRLGDPDGDLEVWLR